jgi:glycerophosphoryl diester phosphodiesterase
MSLTLNINAVESIAHRGASGYAPENTLIAVKKAIELNANYIEIDVQMSIDGEVVAFHDDKMGRTTNGSGKLKDKTLKELKELDAGSWFDSKFENERVPTLKEVLSLNFLSSKLIIEVKNVDNVYPDIENKIVEIVNNSNNKIDIIYKSFSSEVLGRFNRIDPKRNTLYVTIGPLLGFIVIDDWLRFGSIFDLDFVKYIQVHRYLITNSLVRKAHLKGLKIIAWDVHKAEDIQKMIDLGVDLIETDFPDRMNKIF